MSSIAISAIDFVIGSCFFHWQSNLLVGGFKFEEIQRLVIEGERVVDQWRFIPADKYTGCPATNYPQVRQGTHPS